MNTHFSSSHFASTPYLSSHYGRDLAVVEPPIEPQYPRKAGPVSAPGGGFAPYKSPGYPRRDEIPLDQLDDDEEELIIALCAAFLEIIE